MKPGASAGGKIAIKENVGLKKELRITQSRLQMSVEEYEASIEELRLSNEELKSTNKELRSTTKQLVTSQKELQVVIDELAERARHQEGLAELGIYALKINDTQKIIEKAVQNLCKILYMDYCLIYGIVDDKNTMKMLGSNLKGTKSKPKPIPLDGKTDLCFALKSSKPLVTKNYSTENKYSLLPQLNKYEISSGLLINIGDVQKKFGVLGLYSKKPRNYSEQDIHFIQIVAHIIGSSMERSQASKIRLSINKLLEGEVARSGQFQKEILNNSMVQRWKLGEYLHDCLAQILASIKIMVNEIQVKLPDIDEKTLNSKLDIIKSLIDKEVDVIRDLSHDIIPVGIEDEGAYNAFMVLMRRTEKSGEVKCILQTDGILDQINNRGLSTSMYLITQEAMKNAINHGKAKDIKVSIRGNKEYIYLQIQDKGTGFEENSNANEGMGLRIMRHRVELMGGTFAAEKLPDSSGYNTCISCRIPRASIKQILF